MIYCAIYFRLAQKSTLSSRSETLAVATAFTECLQYLISRSPNDEVFCKNLIASQLMPMINWCLIEDLSCFKSICNQIAELVQSWSRNYKKSASFEKYLKFFFDLIGDVLMGMPKVDVDYRNTKEHLDDDIVVVTNKQLEFLHCLKHVPKPKRKAQVKFAVEEADSTKGSSDIIESSVHCDGKYLEFFDNLVFNLCEFYVRYIEEHYCKKMLGNLYSLVLEFNTESIFTKLCEKMKVTNPEATFYNIYQLFLETWYKKPEYNCRHVVDLTFLVFKYSSNEEKDKILESLTQVNIPILT